MLQLRKVHDPRALVAGASLKPPLSRMRETRGGHILLAASALRGIGLLSLGMGRRRAHLSTSEACVLTDSYSRCLAPPGLHETPETVAGSTRSTGRAVVRAPIEPSTLLLAMAR